MWLRLVNNVVEEEYNIVQEDEGELLQNNQLLLGLVELLDNKNWIFMVIINFHWLGQRKLWSKMGYN